MADIDFSGAASPSDWLAILLSHAKAEGWTDIKLRLRREMSAMDASLGQSSSTLLVHARVNRTMREVASLTGVNADAVVNRVKSTARIGTGPARAISDGLYTHEELHPAGSVDENGKSLTGTVKSSLDIRVAVFPTHIGETISLRLPSSGTLATIDDLGLTPHNRALVDKVIGVANGLVLFAGPMGAGKTTSMHALLGTFAGPEKSAWTVEDPVEKAIEGIEQININAEAGNGWPDVLRGLRRSDLEVLMIGEIRDYEQASAALEIGNAGAKVLSSIHANDSVGAVEQLMDLANAQPRTLGNQLRAAISQRLLRLLCRTCNGAGCEACGDSGYKGVRPIHEVLVVDDAFVSALAAGSTTSELRATAEASGMRSLRATAQELVDSGETSLEEVRRVLGND